MESLAAGRIFLHSTLDNRIQTAANDALEAGLRRYEERHPGRDGQVQGALVVLRNRDAAILALVGGRRHYQGADSSWGDLNRAVETRRQPGSTMKPLLYLAAFRSGSMLDGTLPDVPVAVSSGLEGHPKWIANYDGKFQGTIAVREALAQSRNAPTVWLALEIGMGPVLRTARDLGLASSLRPYAQHRARRLRAQPARPRQHVPGHRFRSARRAVHPGPDHGPSGGVRYEPTPQVGPLRVDPVALRQVQEGLRGTVRLPRGTAHALEASGFPVPVMGKTGTTNDFRDALFVGSTYGPEGLTVGVWVGFDDNRTLGPGETGARNALPVFAEVMRGIYEREHLAVAPDFPEAIEDGISSYLSRRQAEAILAAVPMPTARLEPAAQIQVLAGGGGGADNK